MNSDRAGKKYRKRPEFIDVDNAIIPPKALRGDYSKHIAGFVTLFSRVAASLSGKMGGLPYHTIQTSGTAGSVNPAETRNRKSPNPLKEANH